MKNNIILIIKGFLLGIANIIPGVSGGTLAMTLGIYQDLIGAISHFFKKLKKNLKLLIPLGIGMVAAILLGSKVITYCLDKFPFPTTLFFIGLIVGGIPLLTKKVKGKKLKPINIASFLLPFSIVMIMTLLNPGNNIVDLSTINVIKFLLLIVIGMIAAATMVIPGVSGSLVLMAFGYYAFFMNTMKEFLVNIFNFSINGYWSNFFILVSFALGCVLGLVFISKLIIKLTNKYPKTVYFTILGLLLASPFSIIYSTLDEYIISFNVPTIIFSIISFALGVLLVLLGEHFSKKINKEVENTDN